MMQTSFKKAWRQYCARKSRIGIVFDFLFLSFIILMLSSNIRNSMMTYIIRASLFQPKTTTEVIYLDKEDWLSSLTNANGDTVELVPPFDKPTIISFGGVSYPPSKAEFPSQQKLLNRYADSINLYLITDNDIDETQKYMQKRGYKHLLLFCDEDKDIMRGSENIPTSMLIASNGRVIIKKVGAAKWNEKTVTSIIDSLLHKK